MEEPTDTIEEPNTEETVGAVPDGATSFLDTPEVFTEVSGEPDSEPISRPEYIGESHWDSTTGEVRVEALAKSFKDTKAALDKKRDDSGIPESALGYLTTKEDGSLFLPEELPYLPEMTSADPIVSKVAEAALASGVSKSQFDGIMGAYLEGQNQYLSQFAFDKEAESRKIDADPVRAGYVIEGVRTYVSQLALEENESQALDSLMSTGQGVTVMRKLMTLAGRNAIPMGSAASHTPNDTALREEWNQLRKDPASRDRDSALQVRFEKIGHQING